MVQVAGAVSVAGARGQLSLSIEKPAVAMMSLITSGAAPPLLTTMACDWLLLPVVWFPKSTLVGANVTLACVPVPASAISSRSGSASDLTAICPDRAPEPAGAKVVWAWQVAAGARTAGGSGHVSVRVNSPAPPATAISVSVMGARPELVSVTVVGPLVVASG